MKIIVDHHLCQGHGMCEGEAPELFEVTDAGKLIVKIERPPESMRAELESACRFCPTQAIRIEEG